MDSRSVAKHVEDPEYVARPHKLYTLVFPVDTANSKVLLGMKKRGFGKDKLNGFGGKVEPHETIEQGAVRELQEESGLTATHIKKIGLLFFYFENDPVSMEVHVYQSDRYDGRPVESDEMRPEWFGVREMPFERMWADDSLWWPYALENKRFVGRFWFKADQVTITRQELREVDSLEF
ncbi:hypothetical protein EC988_009105 [Linderina pennispora]|nr:hypothetical protein EC988_009105 [Linderina pennispora]